MIEILSLKNKEVNLNLVDYLELGFLEEEELLNVLRILNSRYRLYGFCIFNNEYVANEISAEQAMFRLKLSNNVKNYRLDKYLKNIGKEKEIGSSGEVILNGHGNDKIVLGSQKVFIDIHQLKGKGLEWDKDSKKNKVDLSHYEPIDDLDVLRIHAYDYLNSYFPSYSAFISSSIFS